MKAHIDPSSSNKNATHATWQFAHDMKPGDVVFVKKECINLLEGVVESEYFFDDETDETF